MKNWQLAILIVSIATIMTVLTYPWPDEIPGVTFIIFFVIFILIIFYLRILYKQIKLEEEQHEMETNSDKKS